MRTSVILCFNLIILSVLSTCSDAAFNAGGVRSGGIKNETCKKPPCNDPPPEFDPNDPNSIKVRYGRDIRSPTDRRANPAEILNLVSQTIYLFWIIPYPWPMMQRG